MKKNIIALKKKKKTGDFKNSEKNDLERKIFLSVIDISISFMLDEKYFLYYHNSKRYLGGLT